MSTAYLLGSSEQLIDHATGYLLLLLPGLVPFMWQSIGMMVIRLDGSPKYAMMCNIIPAVVNIGLDWWFVFPLGMGVRGAALATPIAGILGGTMALIYFRWPQFFRTQHSRDRLLAEHQEGRTGPHDDASARSGVSCSDVYFTVNDFPERGMWLAVPASEFLTLMVIIAIFVRTSKNTIRE